MRIVVISGEESINRPIHYGTSGYTSCQVIDVRDEHLGFLLDKFDSLENAPRDEVSTWLSIAMKRARDAIWRDEDSGPDVVVGSGLGAQILANLMSLGEWTGPSVFVAPEGFYKTTHVLHAEPTHSGRVPPTAWILMTGSMPGPYMKKFKYYQEASSVTTLDGTNHFHVHNSGLLSAATQLVTDLDVENLQSMDSCCTFIGCGCAG